ncbi:hypothetical protein [Nocardioides sp. 1609]|uniref:hypothetical protein n=1 Tax=Nocardioides sp. 1609 TaxID=2508327 RepID=UPI00106F646F|nr:hypothetical protein [Nocardioides sp. 1609]
MRRRVPRGVLLSLLTVVALSATLLPGLPTASAAPVSSAAAQQPGPPTWRVYAFSSADVTASSYQVRLVRRASRDAVRGATVRFQATRRTGGRLSARVVTDARGVARWRLPVPSRRLRYLEATYYAPGETETYLQLGLCRRPAGWRECGAG